MARQIQLDLLPSQPPALPCSRIAASSTPSLTVGGDFYDFLHLPDGNRVGIVIADASGKGYAGRTDDRSDSGDHPHRGEQRHTGCRQMMRNMNTQMALATSSEKYVTLFYAVLNKNTRELEYANAGHNHPFIVKPDGSVRYLDVGGPIIGAFPHIDYSSATVQLEEGGCPVPVHRRLVGGNGRRRAASTRKSASRDFIVEQAVTGTGDDPQGNPRRCVAARPDQPAAGRHNRHYAEDDAERRR